jgi:tripartite-type tricarboxylate transporter receptor subunit TctC
MRILASLTTSLTALLIALFSTTAPAQQPWPSKPIRLVVTYPAGGGSDTLGRLVAAELSAALGQPVVVENRPGASGIIGLANVAQSAPDGYTLGVASSGTMVMGPHLQKTMPYDTLSSFTAVGMVAKAPMVLLAAPDFKPDTFAELLAQARANPDKFMIASSAPAFELSLHLLDSAGKAKFRVIPYPGSPQAAVDVIGGRVPMMLDSIGGAAAQIKAGKLRPLAVLDSKRSAYLPEVPTIAEAGVPGYESVGWVAIVAPRGTPPEIVERINAQLQKLGAQAANRAKLETLGFEPAPGSSADLARLIASEHAKWGAVVKAAGIKQD